MCLYIYWAVFDLYGRRILTQVVVAFEIILRPDRSWVKASAATTAYVLQDLFNALFAKRAFIGANHCFGGIRR
jgi:hypothetical protein